MKKLVYYAGILIVVIILLPMFIVKSCSSPGKETPGGKPSGSAGEIIAVYNTFAGKTQQMDLEEYIKGVVAREMPADFDIEALKAQAIAARTFAFGRMTGVYQSKPGVHDGVCICTDPAHCQAWVSKDSIMKQWGIFFSARNWNKINKAVTDTKGIIVTYDGRIANTLFHSNSGGMTENSEEVWEGISVPYLRSVVSSGEEGSNDYKAVVLIKSTDFINSLKNRYPDIKLNRQNLLSNIKILDYTQGKRVKTIKTGNITIKGTEFRSIFNLHSANFKIEKADEDTLRITTLGNGHGVGMSQWGADSLAKKGGTFEEILKYYYTGIELTTIEDFRRGHPG